MSPEINFKNKSITLRTKMVRLPNGRCVGIELITHPGAALSIPFLNKRNIILLRQFRPVLGEYLLELPAGTLRPGETNIRCAKRELMEETGYSAASIVRLGWIYPVPGYSTERITIYKAEKLTKRASCLEADEFIEVSVYSIEQIKKLFKKGHIKDAKTICALSLCSIL